VIVVMQVGAKEKDVRLVEDKLRRQGFGIHRSQGENRVILGVIGHVQGIDPQLETLPGVEKVLKVSRPYKLASREFHPQKSVIDLGGGVKVGGEEIFIMAGPCAVESREQLLTAARLVKESGAHALRGGAYKPRTSPYSFQGLEQEGLEMLAEARQETGLLIVTEVMDQHSVEKVAENADIMQVGTRNMQNFFLLRELGMLKKPVLLKRGMSATIDEWLMAAEYILAEGNDKVILCERGIRTFENATRNTLDLSAVSVINYLSHLPVVVDPSHATGNSRWVPDMSRGALAVGADGLLLEVHPHPEEALCDGPQSLNPEAYMDLMESLRKLAPVVGRRL